MDLSKNTLLAGIAETIGAAQSAATRLECPIYLTGALARDLWLSFGSGIDTIRRTEDIDFAVQCADWRTYEGLATELQSQAFERDSSVIHRFRYANGMQIDLIPFGGVEEHNHQLVWPPDGSQVMNLTGFAEIVADTVKVTLPGGVEVAVVSQPALALLKLLAWDDRGRREAIHKDATDLHLIARHYLRTRRPGVPIEMETELLEANDFEDKLASAQLLGSDMASLGSRELHRAVDLTRAPEPLP